MTARPNSEIVAVQWVLSLPGFPANGCATTLPDVTTWQGLGPDAGFVTLRVVGGTPHPDAPIRNPVLQLDAWAANPNSQSQPAWGKAFDLLEIVKACTEVDSPHRAKTLAMPHSYDDAEVRDTTVLTESRRFPIPDPTGWARTTMDLQMVWTSVHP